MLKLNPEDEALRLHSIDMLGLRSTNEEEDYNSVTRLLAMAVEAPVVAFSVITEDEQLFKSRVGLEVAGTPREISFCGHTITGEDGIMVVPDATLDDRFASNPLVTGEMAIRFYAGVKIIDQNDVCVGTLCVIDRRAREMTDRETSALYDGKWLLEQSLRLRSDSLHDHLTGLLNRRYFDSQIVREWRRAQRFSAPLTVLMIDIDHFKLFNDRFGHQAGDRCLQRVARAIRDCLYRPGDITARYGGEEFIALLADTGADAAAEVAERIRNAVRELAIENPLAAGQYLTVSQGGAVALQEGHILEGVEELIEIADENLYAAKDNGRDCQVITVPDNPET